MEEKDVLGIASAARYGYRNHILPTIVAKNANYESLFFKDFEQLTDESEGVTKNSHSGFYALNLRETPNYQVINVTDGVALTSQMQEKGGMLKLWLQSKDANGELNQNNAPGLTASINGVLDVAFHKVASTGKWTQYEANIKEWTGIAVNQTITMKLKYNFMASEEVLIDDVRLQPFDSEAMCYVYDKYSLRPMAEFGDQHFGVFYQYNNEAQLVRKSIETERGMRTLQENQYNVPRIKRPAL